ncbi:hypothetical protein H4S06_006665, partial [Coemansia sp. BCRC 34490]
SDLYIYLMAAAGADRTREESEDSAELTFELGGNGRNSGTSVGERRGAPAEYQPMQMQIQPDNSGDNDSGSGGVQVYSSGKGASMLSSLFNLTNAIIGAGVIGLPYAMRNAGLLAGVMLIAGVALLVDWTLRMLALNAKLSGRQTYQGLVEHCFGRWGLLSSSLFQGMMAGGGMASFVVIVGDTLPHVLSALLPTVAATPFGRVVFSRRFVVAFFVVCLAYPLSLY